MLPESGDRRHPQASGRELGATQSNTHDDGCLLEHSLQQLQVIPCPKERKYSSAVLKMAMKMRLDTTIIVWHLGVLLPPCASTGFIGSKVIFSNIRW